MRSRTFIKRLRAVLAVGPLVALSWAGAYAAFTDSVDATSSFSTGSVAIQANDQSGSVAFTSLSTSGMRPGTVTYAPLKISNSGSLDATYTMASATSGSAALAAALTVGIKVVGASTCDASAYAGSSTVAYAQAAGVGAAAIAARPLASGTSEYLCFRVELPASADNTLQGLTTNATFTFTAAAS